MLPTGAVAVKTIAKARAAVEKMAPAITWQPIEGNKPYMDWLDAEVDASHKQ